MSIHFKFKSAKEYDTVSFPGTAIRLIDLKKAIVDKKKLTKGLDFDLVIADAQTGAEYEDDNQQLPKNSSVTVKRIPCRHNMGLLERLKQEAAAAAAANAPSLTVPTVSTAGPAHDLVANAAVISPKQNEQLTMEDEMAALQSISKQAEDMRGTRGGNRTWTAGGGSNRITTTAPRGVPVGVRAPVVVNNTSAATAPPPRGFTNRPAAQMTGEAPPENYVCFRCGTPGHYIQHCPTNGDATYDTVRVKKKTGIPKTFMKAVGDRSEIKEGSGLTVVNAPWGGLAVVQAQSKHFSKFVEKSGGAAALDKFRLNPPKHLACKMCSRLMHDAVLIPCCQESACDECLRNALIGNHMQCPLCKTNHMSPERLLPNKVVRASVDEFLKSAQSEVKDRAKLVRETEEKMLAKQRDDAAAIEAATEKTSADSILDLKSAEDDEFGGDIFETTAKSEEKEEKTPQASPVPSNDSKVEPPEDSKPEAGDSEKSQGNEKPQGERPPNQWDPRAHGPNGAPWYNGAPPPWYNGPPMGYGGPGPRGLPPRPNYYGGPPPGYYGQWQRGPPPSRGNDDRYDDRRRGNERRDRPRSGGDRRSRDDRRRSVSPPDRRGRGDRDRKEKLKSDVERKKKDEGVRNGDKRDHKDERKSREKDESRKEKRSSSKRRSPSREHDDSKRDSSRRRSSERDSKRDERHRRDKPSRSSSHRRRSPSPDRDLKRESSRRRSPERDLKRNEKSRKDKSSRRRSPSPRERKRRSPERDSKRNNGRQVSRSAERDVKRTKREPKEDKKSWAERPVLETPRYAHKKHLEKKKSTPTNYKGLSAPSIPLDCLTGEPSPR